MYLLVLIFIFFFIINFVIKKKNITKIASSPFECGFKKKKIFRINFSVQFFLVAILFLIFDVELILILPYILFREIFFSLRSLVIIILFLLILVLGLFYEWKINSLEWAYWSILSKIEILEISDRFPFQY